MIDMEPNDYLHYLCIEPGHIESYVILEPNSSKVHYQIIEVTK